MLHEAFNKDEIRVFVGKSECSNLSFILSDGETSIQCIPPQQGAPNPSKPEAWNQVINATNQSSCSIDSPPSPQITSTTTSPKAVNTESVTLDLRPQQSLSTQLLPSTTDDSRHSTTAYIPSTPELPMVRVIAANLGFELAYLNYKLPLPQTTRPPKTSILCYQLLITLLSHNWTVRV